MKAARAFSNVVVALGESQCRLRITQETFHTSPEPHRAWMSVMSFIEMHDLVSRDK